MAESFTEAERLERLERALRRLPEWRRAIFLEVAQDRASYAEIAERTGLSQRQVERIFADAICRLDREVRAQERGIIIAQVRRFVRGLGRDLYRRLRRWLDRPDPSRPARNAALRAGWAASPTPSRITRMRSDLDHLPDQQQRELERIRQIQPRLRHTGERPIP